MKYLFLFVCLFCLSSCIELLDDIKINSNGSGQFKYQINLSSSRTKINSILALDSIDGNKIPTKPDIEEKIIEFKNYLSKQPGIKNVVIEYNFTDYIFKLSCDFDNVKNLQSAIENSVEKVSNKSVENDVEWLVWSDGKLERNIPSVASERFNNSKWLDLELLNSGIYTSISRFDKQIESCSNLSSKISKNKTAVMIQSKTDELFNNPQVLKNKILLEGQK